MLHEYYKDSYLMPLVESSLKGEAADLANDAREQYGKLTLDSLLPHLKRHYCRVTTYEEQSNAIDGLVQCPDETATSFSV